MYVAFRTYEEMVWKLKRAEMQQRWQRNIFIYKDTNTRIMIDIVCLEYKIELQTFQYS